MNDTGFLLAGAAVAALGSASVAWLFQRMMPRLHPAVTALLGVALLIVLVVIGMAVLFVRSLIAIGAAGHASIDSEASTVSVVLLGVPAIMLLLAVGSPAALVAAFRQRRAYRASLAEAER